MSEEIRSIGCWFDIANSLERFHDVTGHPGGEIQGQVSIEVDGDGTGHYVMELLYTPPQFPVQLEMKGELK